MGQESVLSELCSVCYVQKPKYRCPRCRAQTCSLPCYKRHQQRASCSGKRDTAVYLKKSQWATPGGIDHDYNYLKSLERSIDRAGEDMVQRGIGTGPVTHNKNVARGWRGDSALQRYLIENRIEVQHAPKGMSRQSTNRTRPTKRNRILWTLEWIDGDGIRTVQHDCPEYEKLINLHCVTQRRKLRDERVSCQSGDTIPNVSKGIKRKLENTASAVGKEQRGDNDHESRSNLEPGGETRKVQNSEADMKSLFAETDIIDASSRQSIAETGKPDQTKEPLELQEPKDSVDVKADEEKIEIKTQPTERNLKYDNARVPSNFTDDLEPNDRNNERRQQHFYLLRPSTAASSRVLIPRNPDDTLTEALRGELVQEYPIFYVLPQAPESLPIGFVFEKDYLSTIRDKELKAVDEAEVASNATYVDDAVGSHAEPPDAQSILNMLKRDVTR